MSKLAAFYLRLCFTLVFCVLWCLGLVGQGGLRIKVLRQSDAEVLVNVGLWLQDYDGEQALVWTNEQGLAYWPDCARESISFYVQGLGNYQDSLFKMVCPKGQICTLYLEDVLSQGLAELEISQVAVQPSIFSSMAQERLGKADLQDLGSSSLAQALSGLTGVQFLAQGPNVHLPMIHGLYGNRILILNHGVKHGFQNWGPEHAPEIDLAGIEGITLIKGAAGVAYGPEALAGAILIERARLPFQTPWRGQIQSFGESNGRGGGLNFETSRGYKNLAWQLGGQYQQFGDRHSPDYVLSNTGKKEWSFYSALRYRHRAWDFHAYAGLLGQDLGLLRAAVASSPQGFIQAMNGPRPRIIQDFTYAIQEPRQLTQHGLYAFKVHYWRDAHQKISLHAFFQNNERQEYDVRRNADRPIIDLSLQTFDLQLQSKHRWLSELQGQAGLSYTFQNNENNPGTLTTPFIPNYTQQQFSFYWVESLEKARNSYDLGLRLDYLHASVRGRDLSQTLFQDQFGRAAWSMALGHLRRLKSDWTWRNNLAQAWRLPNMAELYSFGQHGFKTQFGLLRYQAQEPQAGQALAIRTDQIQLFNLAQVKPERGYKFSSELAKESRQDQRFSALLYGHYIQNFVFERPLAVVGTIRGPMPMFIFDQADVLLTGLDLTHQHQWYQTLKGEAGLSLLYTRNLSRQENLINQAPNQLRYRLDYQPAAKGLWSWSCFIQPSYTLEQFQAPRVIQVEDLISGASLIDLESPIFDFQAAPPSYFLLDLGAGLNYGAWQINVQVLNVLNQRYRNYLNELRYFADDLGLNLRLSLRYAW